MSGEHEQGRELTLEGPLTPALLRERAGADFHRICLRPEAGYEALLTREVAQEFVGFPHLRELEIWCKVERSAINEIITLPGLKSLAVIFGIAGTDRLRGFSEARQLETFHCDGGVVERDFLEISRAPALRVLRAQDSKPTKKAVKALLEMPELNELDLESSSFDDGMAELLARSTTLIELEVGASRMTGKGLWHISRIRPLRRLDVWATNIRMDDLDCLKELPFLEYLSVGSARPGQEFAGEKLISKLRAIPALKTLWLDGVDLDEEQLLALEKEYERVVFSPIDD